MNMLSGENLDVVWGEVNFLSQAFQLNAGAMGKTGH